MIFAVADARVAGLNVRNSQAFVGGDLCPYCLATIGLQRLGQRWK
jgi:hypothetical protein